MNQRCQRGRMQLGTVQYSRMPKGHVITHFTRAQHPPVQSRRNVCCIKDRIQMIYSVGPLLQASSRWCPRYFFYLTVAKHQLKICWRSFVTWYADRTEYPIFVIILLCLARLHPLNAPWLCILPGSSASVLQVAGAHSLQAVGGGPGASLALCLVLSLDEPLSLQDDTFASLRLSHRVSVSTLHPIPH